jgi:hypothetical protein
MLHLLFAALLLHPALADDGHLRLVAVGTGHETVEWSLDGQVVAVTHDGEAVRVEASTGPHDLWASSPSEARWRALARPDDGPASGGTGAEVVPAWVAVHEPAAPPTGRSWLLPAGAALGSVAILVRPFRMERARSALRSLLQALRRPRRP